MSICMSMSKLSLYLYICIYTIDIPGGYLSMRFYGIYIYPLNQINCTTPYFLSSLPSFLPSLPPSFPPSLPPFLPSFLPSFPSFLPSFLPPSLPSFLSFFLSLQFNNNVCWTASGSPSTLWWQCCWKRCTQFWRGWGWGCCRIDTQHRLRQVHSWHLEDCTVCMYMSITFSKPVSQSCAVAKSKKIPAGHWTIKLVKQNAASLAQSAVVWVRKPNLCKV